MSLANWEIVIGLETHAQLNTASKIFSGASTAFGAAPNSQACAVDIALPGVLPVLNRGAVERAIRFGLAVGGRIAPRSVFARKNYFYPDLPKGYQISQYELPVVSGGGLSIKVGLPDTAEEKFVRLTRAHLEEDAGKSLHEDFHGRSGIDLNRAGTPLLEIVSEPDMRSAAEAHHLQRGINNLSLIERGQDGPGDTVDRFQRLELLLQLHRHTVERQAQFLKFVAASDVESRRKIPGRHQLGSLFQLA